MNLGPALKGNPLTQNLKVMIMDTNRYMLPDFPATVLSDPDAAKYVDGIAIHWYADDNDLGLTSLPNFETTHNANPDKFMLYTEACTGWTGVQGPSLGDWSRGDQYAHDIMEDLYNWVTGWVDWNMCLDTKGGPNWVNNLVDSPIIVNATSNEFYKNPMYYALGHFSKFITENSVRVQLNTQGITSKVYLEAVAFLTPSNQRVLVINNRDVSTNYAITINDANITDKHLTLVLEPRSFTTIVWN
uniref:Glucosylceramidase n=1 Tax=Acrobeloides nanus TaxID=290746 RepID=A0A914C648_9BILA